MIPHSSLLQIALIEVLKENPEGLSSKKIDELTASKLNISVNDLTIIRSGSRTEFAYRMAWERSHAKTDGIILKLGRGQWKIADQGSGKS